jgi:glycosyltransferase involved in cell wall biosynthesis
VKVLHLGKFDTLGGIERHVKTLARGLIATGETEIVNLVSADSPKGYEHTDYGYPTIAVPCHGMVASVAISPSLPLVARRLHREHRFDIVHLHFPDPLGHLTALTLPRSVRRVISWHSDIIRQRKALALYGPFLRHFVRDVDGLIGATPQHLTVSAQMPPARPGQVRRVVPYGFDPGQMTWSERARAKKAELLARSAGRPVVFVVGRHVYYKGLDVLLRAMAGIDALLIIGGTGPLTADLKRQTDASGLHDRVLFAGFIPDEDLIAYYDVCDVFTMPSTDRSEAFGLVQLEAMHFGKPVVSTRLGTGVEFVNVDGETGLLVPPGDVAALRNAIQHLLADPGLRRRLGDAGRDRVASTFSVTQMVQGTLDTYRSVLRPDAER